MSVLITFILLFFRIPDYYHFRLLDLRFPESETPPLAPAPPPESPPDELSDPNLIPLSTHPGIKYVARVLAATYVH